MTDAPGSHGPIGDDVVAPTEAVPAEAVPADDDAHDDAHDPASFTVRPPPDRIPEDAGGAAPGAGGPGDATHPEHWADRRSLDALRERVSAAGIDPGDRTEEELVTLLKQLKPSNRNDPRRRAGPGADGGSG